MRVWATRPAPTAFARPAEELRRVQVGLLMLDDQVKTTQGLRPREAKVIRHEK
jgi:hypothetical protein